MPVSPRDLIRGPSHAPITLVEYGDYECPYVGEAEGIISRLMDRFHGQLRLVFRNFPLREVHPHAQEAAEAAEAAREQNMFWEMHDALIAHREDLGASPLLLIADTVGLDREKFLQSLTDRKFVQKIAEDLRSGIRSGVGATPTFFINGFRYEGPVTFESLAHEIQMEHAKLSRLKMA